MKNINPISAMHDKSSSLKNVNYPQFFQHYACNQIPNIQKLAMITEIDNIIIKGDYYQDRPLYQTRGDIFSMNKCFLELKKSYYDSIRNYLSSAVFNYFKYPLNINSWAYINWKNSGNYDNGYHCHSKDNPTAISGIYYLHLPMTNASASTTFIIGGKLFKLPIVENTWFLFPSSCFHRPGVCESNSRRYVISADISINEAYINSYLEDSQIAFI